MTETIKSIRSIKALCRGIVEMGGKMPHQEWTEITRTYQKTYQVVILTNENFVTPNKGCWFRIEDLHRAVTAAYDRIRNS